MNKAERASYLVSLHALLEAQTKGSHSIANAILAEEYEKHWGLLKQEIEKDNEDEARNRNDNAKRGEARADRPRGEPRSGEPDRDQGSRHEEASVRGPGVPSTDR